MLSKFIENLLKNENSDEIVCLYFFNSETEFDVSFSCLNSSFMVENCTSCTCCFEGDNIDFFNDMGSCEFYFDGRSYQFQNNKIVEVDESKMLVLC